MFSPFEYQISGLRAIEHARAQGCKRALVVMATGLGKTVLAAFDIKAWLGEHSGSSRILYLCHQNDILYQAKATFQAILGHTYSYGYYHGQEKTAHAVDVLFASLQTMDKSKEMFRPDEFDYVMVDESHHSQAGSYRQTIMYFTPKFLLGVTATPERLDELNIREIFGKEVYSLPLEEAMARGYLAPVEYHVVTDEIQLSGLIESGKEKVSIAQLNRSIFIPKRDEEVVKIIARYVSLMENPRVINFCTSVKHSNHLAEIMPDSFAIHSRIPEKEREVRIEMFRQGLIRTVLVVDSFNEGVDIPSANVISFLRSTDSPTIFLQQLGRGLRKSEGKDKVVVLDFVVNCERVKMINDLYESVKERRKYLQKNRSDRDQPEPMTLNVNSVEFQEKIIPILEILGRVRPNFYPTWQEASKASQGLKIISSAQYQRGTYKGDPRLPFDPAVAYEDFPGWVIFLGKAEKDFYETWKQASEATCALGIKTKVEFRERYREDERLHSSPNKFYKDFPGWGEFLGTWRVRIKSSDTYLFLGEAALATIALGIRSGTEYRKRYREDPRLPSTPRGRYPDFPGWKKFLKFGR